MNERDAFVRRYKGVIGQGCLTNSKHFETNVYGVFPVCVSSAVGVEITDHLGFKYIDYMGGLGTNILGYNNPIVTAAIIYGLRSGQCPSIPTVHEAECAEMLMQMFTNTERWKFFNSGSESCTASAIMARSYTGRDKILSSDYHGWHPSYQMLTSPHFGIVKTDEIEVFEIGKINEEVAAVIIEPDRYTTQELNEIRQLTSENGCVLIYDEIITSFRYRYYSVANYTGCYPDLILLGKAMANGGSISAIGGHKDILNCKYFTSGTFCAETTALSAACAVMRAIQTNQEYQNKNLWDDGGRFKDEFNAISDSIQLTGYNIFNRFNCDWEYLSKFRQEMCRAGYLIGTAFYWHNLHEQYAPEFLHAAKEVIGKIERHEIKMLGPMPVKPMSLITRES